MPTQHGGLLAIVRTPQGLVFERTIEGQFFYDVVMSRQTAKQLAKKWEIRRAEVTRLRRLGRKGLRSKRPALVRQVRRPHA